MIFPKNTGIARPTAANLNSLASKFPGMPGTASSQEKILSIAASYGIHNAEIQQATTRAIYDSLVVNATGFYEFFTQCNTRNLPATNLQKNSLEVGEMLIIESISMSVYTTADDIVVSAYTSLEADSAAWMAGQITATSQNQVIIKPLPLDQMMSTTNPYSNVASQSFLKLDTKLALLPQQPFNVVFQSPFKTAAATKRVRLTLRGTGIIFKPRNGS